MGGAAPSLKLKPTSSMGEVARFSQEFRHYMQTIEEEESVNIPVQMIMSCLSLFMEIEFFETILGRYIHSKIPDKKDRLGRKTLDYIIDIIWG